MEPEREAREISHSSPTESASTSAHESTVFPVEWIRVQTLPFHTIRHLRNPWDQDREVALSTDGTELEPSLGGRLLAEWDTL